MKEVEFKNNLDFREARGTRVVRNSFREDEAFCEKLILG